MGVKGLSTYIEQYCEPYQLHNTLVIVDGGLAVAMCLSAEYDQRFGGNYQKIYNKICQIFNRFKACNITPIVVDDGRFKFEKSNTMRKRYDQKLKTAKSYKDSNFNTKTLSNALSLLYYNAFRHALNDLGIAFCCTEFEADEEMMELARKLNCPVLSQDSDFYLSPGVIFIPWDSIELNKHTSRPYLDCHKFERERFLNMKGVDPSVFPFLSVLFSSDYSQQCLSTIILRRGVHKNDRFEEAINWLRGKTSKEVMQELITRCLPPGISSPQFQSKVNSTVRSYTNCKTTVIPILARNEKIHPYLQNVSFDVQANDVIRKYNVPPYIINKVKECVLTSTILDFFVADEFECKTIACEDVDEESAHNPSVRLIEGIYGILAKYLPEKSMSLIIRNKRELETRELNPLLIRNENPYKILQEIMEISDDVMENLRDFDGRWIVFILTLIYWRNKCQDKINDLHIHSLILTAFACHVVKFHNTYYSFDSKFPLNHFCDLNPEDFKTFFNKKINRWAISKHNNIILNDISHIHVYLMFQTCLHRSQPLFPLLNLPFFDFRVQDFVSGDMYHSIYNEIKNMPNCQQYIDQLFTGFDRLRYAFNSVMSNKVIADLF